MMIPRQKALSRRTVLRGAGVALGLPWLEAMVPSALAAVRSRPARRSPVRMAVLYMANGVNTSQWTPEGQGRDFRLSPTLEPLEELKDQVLVVSNLWNAAAKTGDGHYAKESSLLTCTTITKTSGRRHQHPRHVDGPGGCAARWAARRRCLRSNWASNPSRTGVDANVGYTRVYGCHIAWSGPTTPLARETNPRNRCMQRLFRAASPAGNSAKQDTLVARSRAGRIEEDALHNSAPPIRPRWTSTCRSFGRSKKRMERASDPKRTWKPLRVDSIPAGEPPEDPVDATRSTSG